MPDTSKSQSLNRHDWLTAKESAQVTGYNPEYIRQLARSGVVQSRKVAATLLVSRASLLAHQKSMRLLGAKRFSNSRARQEQSDPGQTAALGGSLDEDGVVAPATRSPQPVKTALELNQISDQEMKERYAAVRRALREWRDETGPALEEQRATGVYLAQALDEDRPSNRSLFPGKQRRS